MLEHVTHLTSLGLQLQLQDLELQLRDTFDANHRTLSSKPAHGITAAGLLAAQTTPMENHLLRHH